MSANPHRIAWIDLETTGLDETTGHILEIGIVITDNDLNEVEVPFSMIVAPGDPNWKDSLNEFVLNMHTANGLIDAIDRGEGLPLTNVEDLAAAYLQRTCTDEGKPMLGGNSITFDRNWLEFHTPELFNLLHYRSIDVTSLDQFATRTLGMDYQYPEEHKVSDHRSLGDLRRSIAVAKAIRSVVTS